jgi:hypothetical protein
MPQILERFHRDALQVRQSTPAARTDHPPRAERKELILGFYLASAISAFEELRSKPQMIKQTDLIVTDDQPNVMV